MENRTCILHSGISYCI
uniref:Uncharacterized protein n=1 Tax=Anguilla anguilla TaxID=7936 RepID=A0A0E9XSA5_ANGAN